MCVHLSVTHTLTRSACASQITSLNVIILTTPPLTLHITPPITLLITRHTINKPPASTTYHVFWLISVLGFLDWGLFAHSKRRFLHQSGFLSNQYVSFNSLNLILILVLNCSAVLLISSRSFFVPRIYFSASLQDLLCPYHIRFKTSIIHHSSA